MNYWCIKSLTVSITIKLKYLRVGIFSIFYAIYFTLRKHKQLVHVYVIELLYCTCMYFTHFFSAKYTLFPEFILII